MEVCLSNYFSYLHHFLSLTSLANPRSFKSSGSNGISQSPGVSPQPQQVGLPSMSLLSSIIICYRLLISIHCTTKPSLYVALLLILSYFVCSYIISG
jgi:hypothetical protein